MFPIKKAYFSNSFISNKQTEALRDRIVIIRVPYNLQVAKEVEIYRKLISEGQRDGTHLAPCTPYVASVVAILSRLQPAPGINGLPKLSPLEKMKLYDGFIRPPYTKADVDRLQEASPQEGMFGLSPRLLNGNPVEALFEY